MEKRQDLEARSQQGTGAREMQVQEEDNCNKEVWGQPDEDSIMDEGHVCENNKMLIDTITTATTNNLTPTDHVKKKSYITDKTWKMIEEKGKLENEIF